MVLRGRRNSKLSIFREKLPVPAVLFTASQFESRVVKTWKLWKYELRTLGSCEAGKWVGIGNLSWMQRLEILVENLIPWEVSFCHYNSKRKHGLGGRIVLVIKSFHFFTHNFLAFLHLRQSSSDLASAKRQISFEQSQLSCFWAWKWEAIIIVIKQTSISFYFPFEYFAAEGCERWCFM